VVKELEAENAKLKRSFAEIAPDSAALKKLIARTQAEQKREAMRFLSEVHSHPLSQSTAATARVPRQGVRRH